MHLHTVQFILYPLILSTLCQFVLGGGRNFACCAVFSGHPIQNPNYTFCQKTYTQYFDSALLLHIHIGTIQRRLAWPLRQERTDREV